ncbi:hypothetical protein [Parasitella parasitica]|uniref:Reverse transcriptase domain-containing protein n=1 Tax=Parasitella parasitica TaxID=35722 RepID=A0A0B7MSM9_9FUNG|nr:hypothetical protein [Parasitella parasitica]
MKRLATQQDHQPSIEMQYHPDTGTLCSSPSDLQSASQNTFNIVTNQILPSGRLPTSFQDTLCAPFQAADLLDGLPYGILFILFDHPATLQLALQVFDAALSSGDFLLLKKGDLSQLKNRRPMSLINTDAELFTRLINFRHMTHLSARICTMQMGFMQNRFIGEQQGMIVQCLQEIATASASSTIAHLLDQEKAYDRVHLDYLRACMAAFHIPTALTTAIINSFSSTTGTVNVSGFLSPSFQQRRGPGQGDPLSPFVFNSAF